jgi:hypothetical protein
MSPRVTLADATVPHGLAMSVTAGNDTQGRDNSWDRDSLSYAE